MSLNLCLFSGEDKLTQNDLVIKAHCNTKNKQINQISGSAIYHIYL